VPAPIASIGSAATQVDPTGRTISSVCLGCGVFFTEIGYEFGIDLEAVEHIEVIRGPGSALYGGNALFAVINVVTFDGATKPGVHALMETGSFWRKRAQLSVGHVTDGGLSVFASGSILDVDGQDELFYPEFDDPSTNDGIAEDADGERALNFRPRCGCWIRGRSAKRSSSSIPRSTRQDPRSAAPVSGRWRLASHSTR
jgi:outer membrane receptor protein involved in Fe transport